MNSTRNRAMVHAMTLRKAVADLSTAGSRTCNCPGCVQKREALLSIGQVAEELAEISNAPDPAETADATGGGD
jgi:hypothetical protein